MDFIEDTITLGGDDLKICPIQRKLREACIANKRMRQNVIDACTKYELSKANIEKLEAELRRKDSVIAQAESLRLDNVSDQDLIDELARRVEIRNLSNKITTSGKATTKKH